MNNTKQIIDNHNKRILTASIQIDDTATAAAATIDNNKTCNCRQKNACPLDGNCLQSSVIYQATVTRKDNNTTETYIGLTENDFKTRCRNHTASFRHAKHRNSTELSKHIWTLKDNNIEHFISWRILSSHSPYNSSSKRCNLCLKEKFLIICRPQLSTLNKRNELVPSCRHRNKALLRNNQTFNLALHKLGKLCCIKPQTCRDELVVYLFFSSIYTSLYFYVLSTVLRKSSFTLVKFSLVKHSTIIRHGKIQHQPLNQEYSFTITQRLPSATHRNHRAVFKR